MKTVYIFEKTGSFAENKDTARNIRINLIKPLVEKDESVTLDFKNVDSATQSFIHALISQMIRKQGSTVLDSIYFKNCNENVRRIVDIVVEYMQI